jgi:hypothetical protein
LCCLRVVWLRQSIVYFESVLAFALLSSLPSGFCFL